MFLPCCFHYHFSCVFNVFVFSFCHDFHMFSTVSQLFSNVFQSLTRRFKKCLSVVLSKSGFQCFSIVSNFCIFQCICFSLLFNLPICQLHSLFFSLLKCVQVFFQMCVAFKCFHLISCVFFFSGKCFEFFVVFSRVFNGSKYVFLKVFFDVCQLLSCVCDLCSMLVTFHVKHQNSTPCFPNTHSDSFEVTFS